MIKKYHDVGKNQICVSGLYSVQYLSTVPTMLNCVKHICLFFLILTNFRIYNSLIINIMALLCCAPFEQVPRIPEIRITLVCFDKFYFYIFPFRFISLLQKVVTFRISVIWSILIHLTIGPRVGLVTESGNDLPKNILFYGSHKS